MRRSSIFGAAALLAVTALSVGAQQQEHRHGRMESQDSTMSPMHRMHGGMMQGGMMGMMQAVHPGPGMILDAAGELDLTPDQEVRLTTLRDEMQTDHQQHMQAAMASHEAAAEALRGETPDLAAYREHLEAAAGHMVTMHVAMARAGLDARDVLTGEQQEKLDEVVSRMRHMHGEGMEMGHGGMNGHGSGMHPVR